MNSPLHVAIIMDGNGRWGLKKKKSRNYGHRQGVKIIKDIAEEAICKKIKFLTLFTFSTENWRRPNSEINYLLNLMSEYIDSETNKFIRRGIKIKIIGNINKFPIKLKKKLKNLERITTSNKKLQLNIALNYGSRQEIINSINKLKKKKLKITEENLEKNLYTKNIPDPDLLIRTGNTKRLSNFLMWQSIYTEIYFENKLWPDFKKKDFIKILNIYRNINRNFGGLNDQH